MRAGLAVFRDPRRGIAAAAAQLTAWAIQLAVISVLHTGFGIGTADAFAYGVILQAVEIATAVALGVPALVREGLTWSDLRVQALSASPVRLEPKPSAQDGAREGVRI